MMSATRPTDPQRTDSSTRRPLLAGAIAAPVFVVSSITQAWLRSGFDPHKHPPSALALGDSGWVQSGTFVIAGVLFVIGAVGLRRSLAPTGPRWAPRCIGIFGLALAAGGIFVMDPAFGFPPGTPNGVGDDVSWHAAMHGILFPLGFAAILVTCFVMAHRYAEQGRRLARWTSMAVGPLALVLASWPNLGGAPDGRFLPMWAGVAIAFIWLSAVLADAARESTPVLLPELRPERGTTT
jgi:hypothetical protein